MKFPDYVPNNMLVVSKIGGPQLIYLIIKVIKVVTNWVINQGAVT